MFTNSLRKKFNMQTDIVWMLIAAIIIWMYSVKSIGDNIPPWIRWPVLVLNIISFLWHAVVLTARFYPC